MILLIDYGMILVSVRCRIMFRRFSTTLARMSSLTEIRSTSASGIPQVVIADFAFILIILITPPYRLITYLVLKQGKKITIGYAL